MLSVGRMLPLFKGDYNTETEYVMLDVVLHKGTSWVAKKRVKDIEPSETNEEYWQILFRISEATLNEITKAVHEYLADPTHIIPIANGGTGASTVEEARANLGFPHDYITSIENGGTGASTPEEAIINLGLKNILKSYAKYQIVSYVGTGLAGVNNPNSLTFDFAPKALVLLGCKNYSKYGDRINAIQTFPNSDEEAVNFIACDELTTEYESRKGFCMGSNYATHLNCCKKSEDGKTISWYAGDSDTHYVKYQCNVVDVTYYVLALGQGGII